MYLLIFTDLFAYLRVDHCFSDGSVGDTGKLNHKTAD